MPQVVQRHAAVAAGRGKHLRIRLQSTDVMEQARIDHDLVDFLDPCRIARRIGKSAEEIGEAGKLLLVGMLARA